MMDIIFLATVTRKTYDKEMKLLSVGKLKARFSEVLDLVKQGEKIGILYGKSKRPVAMIVPFEITDKKQRKIGLLDGKVKIRFNPDFKITGKEFLGLK